MAREISKCLASKHFSEAKKHASVATYLTLIASSVTSIVVAIFLFISDLGIALSLCGALMTILLSLNGTWSGIGRAYGHFFWALAPREVLWRTLAIASVGLLVWNGIQVNSLITAVLLLVSIVICATAQFFALGMRKFDKEVRHLNDAPTPKMEMLRASRDIGLVNVGGLVIVTMDIVIVGLVLGEQQAAEYFPANRLAILTTYFHITLNLIVGPKFAQHFKLEQSDAVKNLCQLAARLSFAVSIFMSIVIFFSRPYLHLVFDTATDTTWLIAFILSLGHVAGSALGFGGTALISSGNQKTVRKIMVWSIPVTLLSIVIIALTDNIIYVAATVATLSFLRLIVVAISCHNKLNFTGAAI